MREIRVRISEASYYVKKIPPREIYNTISEIIQRNLGTRQPQTMKYHSYFFSLLPMKTTFKHLFSWKYKRDKK